MKVDAQKTILVSGASGLVGYGILKSLRGLGFKLIGTTIYEHSPANCFADVVELVPKTTESQYMDYFIEVIKKHSVDMIIPSIEADMIKWNEFRDVLRETGSKLLLNNATLINLCTDKWKFYQRLNKFAPFYAIDSRFDGDFFSLEQSLKLPFLLKPRRGFASQGIVKVANKDIFENHKSKLGTTHMAQPIIGSDEAEYTVSAFFDEKSNLLCYQQLRRTLSKEGFTEYAETVHIHDVEKVLKDLAAIFKPIGPTNFQFRYQDMQIKLLEINPRISSATSIRTAFGYNESIMSVEYFLNNIKPVQPKIKSGHAIRYTEDMIFYNDSDNI